MSQLLTTCPICLTGISTEGDHKMCSLHCGHIFGYICIYQWLEHKKECPICRKEANIEDIVCLVWDGKIPSDAIVDQLSSEKDQILGKNQLLEKELSLTKLELDKTKDALSQMVEAQRNFQDYPNFGDNSSNYSSIIYERKVVDGFRLHTRDNKLFVTERLGKKFGVRITSLSNFKTGHFISIHDGQIRDLNTSSDFSSLVTVSIDKAICIAMAPAYQVTNRYYTSVPLWSCCWASQTLVAAGGNDGKLFLRDTRVDNHSMGQYNNDSSFQMMRGPPIFSVMSLDASRLLCVSPMVGRCFDLRNAKFEPNLNNIDGGTLASSCINENQQPINLNNKLVVVESRMPPNSAKCVFYQQKQNGLLQPTNEKKIKYFTVMSRPSIIHNNGITYVVLPDEDSKDFCVFSTNRLDVDLWSKYRKNFSSSIHPSPILDTSAQMTSPSQIMICSVSSSLLKINLMQI